MSDRLWIPPSARVQPTEVKKEGGSYFDDELETEEEHQRKFQKMMNELIDHLQKRPDHTVFVGTTKDREQIRTVFNHWKEMGVINYWPTVKIDYGVPEGQIRVDEDRS